MSEHMPSSGKWISRSSNLVFLLVALVLLLAIISGLQKGGYPAFSSSELRFTDASSDGLAIVPASCPSSPHYSGDCSSAVEGGGSGTGACTPRNVCLNGNLVNSCTGAQVQACSYGCSGGCLPPPPPTFTEFTATYVSGGGSGESGGGSGGTPVSFTASGHLIVRPTLVLAGDTVQVYWNVSGAASCAVTSANNTDSWSTASSGDAGVTSSPILGQTEYTLLCQSIPGAIPATVTESQTVTVIPTFQEL